MSVAFGIAALTVIGGLVALAFYATRQAFARTDQAIDSQVLALKHADRALVLQERVDVLGREVESRDHALSDVNREISQHRSALEVVRRQRDAARDGLQDILTRVAGGDLAGPSAAPRVAQLVRAQLERLQALGGRSASGTLPGATATPAGAATDDPAGGALVRGPEPAG